MTAMNALELARSYGVRFLRKPDGSSVVYQAKAAPPPDVVAVLAAAKPDFLRVLAGREAARTALNATAPPDCLPRRWTEAQDGLRRFVNDGYGDQATLLCWTVDEERPVVERSRRQVRNDHGAVSSEPANGAADGGDETLSRSQNLAASLLALVFDPTRLKITSL
jgi:hypothetical protein